MASNSSTKVAQENNWSSLPYDLLELVSSKLSFFDFLSFKGVCSSWRVASDDEINHHQKPFPLVGLFLSNKNILEIDTIKLQTLSIKEGRQYTLNKKTSSGFQRNPDYYNFKIIGSHHDGWLIMFSGYHNSYYLQELLTHVRIQLPKKIKGSRYQIYGGYLAILSDNPNRCQDFIVIMMYSSDNYLAFWRNGDEEWSPLEPRTGGRKTYWDIAWCNHKLYALSLFQRSVEIWDFSTGSCIPEKKMSINTQPDLEYQISDAKLVSSRTSDGILLATYIYDNWSIYKVDLGQRRCVELKSLDGRAMLIADDNKVILSSIEVENYGYKPNSIYNARTHPYKMEVEMIKYSLEDEKSEQLWDFLPEFGHFGLFLLFPDT